MTNFILLSSFEIEAKDGEKLSVTVGFDSCFLPPKKSVVAWHLDEKCNINNVEIEQNR